MKEKMLTSDMGNVCEAQQEKASKEAVGNNWFKPNGPNLGHDKKIVAASIKNGELQRETKRWKED